MLSADILPTLCLVRQRVDICPLQGVAAPTSGYAPGAGLWSFLLRTPGPTPGRWLALSLLHKLARGTDSESDSHEQLGALRCKLVGNQINPQPACVIKWRPRQDSNLQPTA